MADWDPELYHRFQRYRAEPVDLILERLPLTSADTIADFGCGTGEYTVELARRAAPDGTALGLDSSPAMIHRARALCATLEPPLARRLRFVEGDFRTIEDDARYSVIFSNAALQWATNHRDVLARWTRALKPGGRIVVQMPSNHEETAQMTLVAMTADAVWQPLVGDLRTPSHAVGTADEYRTMLEALGLVDVACYYHVFHHPMTSPAAIVEFTRATALRPFFERIPVARHDEFIADFTQRLERAYGTNGPLIFEFRRLFLWARRPA
ncbi:MAG TPA: methyltransferase domain-containing protein [Candidatus Binataceae bacterium]|nr:methyltransferase domain-containing protein [Candidatus Binataceae bacterium]